ncbi:MAG: hypothetical protein IK000_04980 [Bacteroidaceae bacterium]|nr:hypothetical protein [Bacteroidaceae bacterium]
MKKTSTLLTIILLVASLSSCSVTRYTSQTLRETPVNDIPVIEPYSSIYQLSLRDNEELSDSLTNVAHEHLLDILEAANSFPTGSVLYMQDADFYQEIGYEGAQLFDRCYGNKKKNIEALSLPESLREFMHDNNLPYVMLIFQDGFTRTSGDYALEVGAAVAEAILTTVLSLGTITAYSVPLKDNLNYRVLIADAEANRVAYFNRVSVERNPTSRSNNFYMMERAFSRYPKK